jgi:hypothetical protein
VHQAQADRLVHGRLIESCSVADTGDSGHLLQMRGNIVLTYEAITRHLRAVLVIQDAGRGDSHDILGQSPSFVGAEDVDGTESFHSHERFAEDLTFAQFIGNLGRQQCVS